MPDIVGLFLTVVNNHDVSDHLVPGVNAEGMLLNIAALAVLILFGCHNPFMFNQSTLVLGRREAIFQR